MANKLKLVVFFLHFNLLTLRGPSKVVDLMPYRLQWLPDLLGFSSDIHVQIQALTRLHFQNNFVFMLPGNYRWKPTTWKNKIDEDNERNGGNKELGIGIRGNYIIVFVH